MISNLKKILIIFSIFLTVVAFILLSNEKKQSILITEDILETKDLNIKHSQEEKNPKLFAKNLKELSSPMLISCSIDDYKTACRGEIPLKWLFFYQKSNNFS